MSIFNNNKIKDSDNTELIQFVVFHTNDNNYYGIDAKKVRFFVQSNDCKISSSLSDNAIVEGFVVIRKETYVLTNLDKWLKHTPLSLREYKYIILVEVGEKKQQIALLATKIIRIYTQEKKNLDTVDLIKDKVEYVTKISVNNEEELCLILNVDDVLKTLQNVNLEEIPYEEN